MNYIKLFIRFSVFALVIVSLTACTSRKEVRDSASFTLTQVTVLRSNMDSHFEHASKSIIDQKMILQNQFGVNLRLKNAETMIVSLASSGDTKVKSLFDGLKKAADAMEASDMETFKARSDFEAQLATIISASAPGGAAFSAVSSPLQGLSQEKTPGEQLKFLTAYWKSVWEETEALNKAQEEAESNTNAAGSKDASK